MKDKTCFVIAHRLSTVQNADTILVVQHGDIIELGKTKLMFVPFSSDAFDWDWTQA